MKTVAEQSNPSTVGKLEASEIKEVTKPEIPQDTYVLVEIPASDLFDHVHPGVQLNRHKFEAGKVYSVRKDVADEVKKRLAVFTSEQVRLLRPNADRKALNDVNRGSQWTSRGGQSIALDGGLGEVADADSKVYTVDF